MIGPTVKRRSLMQQVDLQQMKLPVPSASVVYVTRLTQTVRPGRTIAIRSAFPSNTRPRKTSPSSRKMGLEVEVEVGVEEEEEEEEEVEEEVEVGVEEAAFLSNHHKVE